jgi:quercetin dioxygenase-like cupin family protein
MKAVHLKKLPEVEPVPGYKGRFVHTDHMTFAFWDIKEGYAVPEHEHPNEQVCTVLEGTLALTVDGEKHLLNPGMVFIIPAGIRHAAYSVSDCKVMDTFYPVREDYKNL